MIKHILEVNVSEIDSSEVFFVDTNILLALHFGLSRWNDEKKSAYANFVFTLLNRGNELCVSMLILQELYNLIEKLEYEQYRAIHENISRKGYRKICSERERIANDLRSKHLEIVEYYTLVQSSVTQNFVENFINRYESHLYEPIDFMMVKHNGKNCINFITDDSDFRNDSGISVYFY